jgi:hypothetical protein
MLAQSFKSLEAAVGTAIVGHLADAARSTTVRRVGTLARGAEFAPRFIRWGQPRFIRWGQPRFIRWGQPRFTQSGPRPSRSIPAVTTARPPPARHADAMGHRKVRRSANPGEEGEAELK